MEEKTKRELSIRRVVILQNQLVNLRKGISSIQDTCDEGLKESYTELEDAFSKVFNAEAKYQVEI